MPTEFNDAQHYGIFATSATLNSQTGKMVRQSELTLAALRAAGVLDNMEDGTTAPATDKLWLDKNTDPAVLKEYDSIGSAWVPMTFERLFSRQVVTDFANVGGTGNAITVDEPSAFIPGRVYGVTATAANTGATTLTVTGVGTYDVVYPNGSALAANEFSIGQRTILLFTSGRFEVVFGGNIAGLVSTNNLSDVDNIETAQSNLSVVPHVASRTALKAADTTKIAAVILTEGAGEAHGRFGLFQLGDYADWSAVVTVDTLEGYVIRSTFDTNKVWVRDCEALIPQHFGAAGSGSAGGGNDAPALECFYNVCLTARKRGYIPPVTSTYYCTEQVHWDMGIRASGAPEIFGGGEYSTRIEFADGVTSPNFKISSPSVAAIFYHYFGHFGIIGNTSGIVFQVGEDDFSDALNGCEIWPMRVLNNNQTSGAEAVRLNWLLNTPIDIGCNGPGLDPGDGEPYDGTIALHPRRLQDCAVWGAVGGAAIGFLFDTANQYGNTFNNFNHETLSQAIQVSASIRDNTWKGGMAAIIDDAFLNATDGLNNTIDGINFAASVPDIIKNISATDSTWGGRGFNIVNKRETSIHTFPSLSTTGTGGWTRNAGGQPVMVSLYGGTVTSVFIRRVPSTGSGNQIANGSNVNFLVMPGEEWQVNYSGLPNQQVRVAG